MGPGLGARAGGRRLREGRPDDDRADTTINIGRDSKTAEAELNTFVEGYYAAPYDAVARTQGYHGGDAASCLERLREFVPAGVRHIVVRFGGGDQDEQLDRMTREILPRLKG